MEIEFRRRTVIAVAVAVLLLFVVGYGVARHFRPDPQLAKVKALREELSSEAVRNLPAEERRERWKQLGEEMKQLSPDQREELNQERHREYIKKLDNYFALPKKEQVAHLDREIERGEAMRKQMEKARAERAAKGTTSGAGGGPVSFGSPGGGPGSGGKSKAAMSEEERDRRRKDRLDRTEPEDRAKMAEYRKQMEARRQERGLPPSPWGGR